MYQPDKSHPSAAGSYLYGAVLYASLFGKNPAPVNYLGECEKRSRKKRLRSCATSPGRP